MNPPVLDSVTQFLHTYVLPFGGRMLGALALWIIGGWIIPILIYLWHNAMAVRHVDKTLSHYAEAAIRFGLCVILCIALLGAFGIETTSLAALLAAKCSGRPATRFPRPIRLCTRRVDELHRQLRRKRIT